MLDSFHHLLKQRIWKQEEKFFDTTEGEVYTAVERRENTRARVFFSHFFQEYLCPCIDVSYKVSM